MPENQQLISRNTDWLQQPKFVNGCREILDGAEIFPEPVGDMD